MFFVNITNFKMGKVIQHPDKDLAPIKGETTAVAGVINREMIALQKKFPDHYFELSFELQRLGPQKFYKIHIKTFNEVKEERSTPVRMLLSFIHAQGLELENYHSLIEPIDKLFTVWEWKGGTKVPGTRQMIDRVIRWQKGEQQDSLEATISRLFIIEIGKR